MEIMVSNFSIMVGLKYGNISFQVRGKVTTIEKGKDNSMPISCYSINK
jgi:hypothetical protein